MASEKHQIKMILWTMMVIIGLSLCLGHSMLEPPHLYRHRIAVAQARLLQIEKAMTQTDNSGSRMPASIGNSLTAIQDSAAGQRVSNERRHRINGDRGDHGDDFFPELMIETYDVVLPCVSGTNSKVSGLVGTHAFVPKTVKQVRVLASQCDRSGDFAEMQISNQSNGFSATIFETAHGTWLTDYISLSKASSVIRLAFENAAGENQTRDFVIERAPETEPTP